MFLNIYEHKFKEILDISIKNFFIMKGVLTMNTEYISLREFCERTQISSTTAYRMIRNGQLPAFKIGRNYRIPINAIVEINTKPRMY